MSVDINAVLYYGFPFLWNEDYEMDEKEHERLSTMVDEDDDSVPYPKEGKLPGDVALGKSGDFYNGYLVHYVYIVGSEMTAGRWDAADLDPRHLHLCSGGWDAKLEEFCKEYDIPAGR